MNYDSIVLLAGALLTISSAVFGAKYNQGKKKASQLTKLLSTIIDAAQDDEVTEKELQKIVASVKTLLEKPEAQSS